MKLDIDRAILRDIMEARAATSRQHSYYIIGSIFAGMAGTLLFLRSDNYTAISALTMIAMFYYSCISCNRIDYTEDLGVSKKMEEMDCKLGEVFTKVSTEDLTGEEKIALFKELFYELTQTEFEDEELSRMIEIVQDTKDDDAVAEEDAAEEESTEEETLEKTAVEPSTDDVIEQLRKVEADTQARNLVRAQTSYSDTELRQNTDLCQDTN